MNVFDVMCPTCGAPEGKGCMTASGKKTGTHTARKKYKEVAEGKVLDDNPRGGLARAKAKFDRLKKDKRAAKAQFEIDNPRRRDSAMPGFAGPRFHPLANRESRRSNGQFRNHRRGAKRRALVGALNRQVRMSFEPTSSE